MRFEHEEQIARPPADVFAFLSEPANLPRWQSGVVETRRDSEGAMSVGARFTEVRTFAGRRVESQLEVTELEPPRVFSLRVVSGPVRLTVRHVLEPFEGGTRLRAVGEGEPGGSVPIPGPLLARAVKKQARSDFAALKRLLEAS
ncbi:MAG: SRPBCC family protein [Actinobacteria bacterium]|nr:SRPBCC family protein [Actinomycetota bacterium]